MSSILLGALPAFLSAQVVQLPTIQTFGTQGTVVVPDQGGISLGSVNRAAMGSTRRGLPFIGGGPRAIGKTVSHAGASVHATIINLEELDRETLARAAANRAQRVGNENAGNRGLNDSNSLESLARQHQQFENSRPARMGHFW